MMAYKLIRSMLRFIVFYCLIFVFLSSHLGGGNEDCDKQIINGETLNNYTLIIKTSSINFTKRIAYYTFITFNNENIIVEDEIITYKKNFKIKNNRKSRSVVIIKCEDFSNLISNLIKANIFELKSPEQTGFGGTNVEIEIKNINNNNYLGFKRYDIINYKENINILFVYNIISQSLQKYKIIL